MPNTVAGRLRKLTSRCSHITLKKTPEIGVSVCMPIVPGHTLTVLREEVTRKYIQTVQIAGSLIIMSGESGTITVTCLDLPGAGT